MSIANCPHCGQGMTVTPDLAGRTVKCPACHRDLVLPAPAPLPAASPPPVQNFTPSYKPRKRLRTAKKPNWTPLVIVAVSVAAFFLLIICSEVGSDTNHRNTPSRPPTRTFREPEYAPPPRLSPVRPEVAVSEVSAKVLTVDDDFTSYSWRATLDASSTKRVYVEFEFLDSDDDRVAYDNEITTVSNGTHHVRGELMIENHLIKRIVSYTASVN